MKEKQNVGLILSTSASDCTWNIVSEDVFAKCMESHGKDWDFSTFMWQHTLMEEINTILGEWNDDKDTPENVLKTFYTQSFAYEDTKFLTQYNILGILPLPEC